MTKLRKFVYFIGMNWREDGAVSDHFRKLAQFLVDRGHQVVLIVDSQRHDLENHSSNPAIYTWPSQVPSKLQDMFFLRDLIKRYHPHCLIGIFRAVNIQAFVGWLMRVPYRISWYRTTSNQSVYEINRPNHLQRIYQIQRKKLVYKFSTHIITSTEAMRRDLFNVYRVPGSKVKIFPNSISVPDERLLHVHKNNKKIICVGRLCKLKGQDTLLHAVALIKSDFPGLRVDFLGSGPMSEKFQKLAIDLGVVQNCFFHGAVQHKAVLENMATSVITVVPSKDEAFGYVNIESMSVGTPVVASNVGGIPEVVRDGIDGYLVPPDDPKILAARIEQLLNDESLRTQMGENARNRFLENFEQSKAIEIQVRYFEELGAEATSKH